MSRCLPTLVRAISVKLDAANVLASVGLVFTQPCLCVLSAIIFAESVKWVQVNFVQIILLEQWFVQTVGLNLGMWGSVFTVEWLCPLTACEEDILQLQQQLYRLVTELRSLLASKPNQTLLRLGKEWISWEWTLNELLSYFREWSLFRLPLCRKVCLSLYIWIVIMLLTLNLF